MLNFYQTNELTVTEITEYSVYVDGGEEHGSILLREVEGEIAVGDQVNAYVYYDSSDDVVATMATAIAEVGECAYLTVVSDGQGGTFLDWGLPKDLLLPFSEQNGRVREGRRCFVYIFLDDYDRPTASMKIHRFLNEGRGDLRMGQEVDLMISAQTDLGFKAVINNEQLGLIHHGELARPLQIGARMTGWVQDLRPDGKVNLNINKLSTEVRDQLEQAVLDRLNENEGRLELSDKSSPDVIFKAFNVSKKNFKRALGSLYKQRLINIEPTYIELIAEGDAP